MSSFSTALSGLMADNTALDVVGNNLANLTTTGYKTTDVLFHDLFDQISGGAQIGGGVGPSTTSRIFTQGNIQATGGAFDAAIQGSGFFVVRDSSGNSFYTRDGSFSVDGSGALVDSNGQRVQGWTAANGVVNTGGATGDLIVSSQSLQTPSATTTFSLSANLNASAAVGDTFSTPIQVVDSLGTTHTLTVTFKKTDANAWSYDVGIPGQDLKSGKAGTVTSVATGNITFDSNGKLTSPAAPKATVDVKVPGLGDGAADMDMSWNFLDANGNPTMTQFAQ